MTRVEYKVMAGKMKRQDADQDDGDHRNLDDE